MIKPRASNINNWFLPFLILYSGDGISFLNHDVSPIALGILLGMSFYWKVKNNIPLIGFFKIITPWIIYCTISFTYFEAVRPTFLIILPIVFFSVFVLIKSNPELKDLFNSFERIIHVLAKISIFFYVWQFINESSLISIFSLIDLNYGTSYNAIVYTIHHRSIGSGIPQNSGFCWEPGPFACFLILSLVVYLLNNDFKADRRVFFYLFTVVSTGSSTGYLCLMVILIWFYYVKSKKIFVLILPLVMIVISLIFNYTSSLKDKIANQMNNAQTELDFYIENGAEQQTSIGRFNGLLLNLKDFNKNPIIGFGGNFNSTFAEENNLNITSTSGLGNWLAQYGLVGFIFLLICFYRSSGLLVYLYKGEGLIFLITIYLIMSFSFNLMEISSFILFFFTNYISKLKITKSRL